MQIVIEISDDSYKQLLDDRKYRPYSMNWRDYAISNGKPLPKGHGRIADMDEVIKCIKDIEGDDAIWAISLIEWACAKRTILEADTEESEG